MTAKIESALTSKAVLYVIAAVLVVLQIVQTIEMFNLTA